MIEAVIFSYKNKNLKTVVDDLINNTASKIIINVFDKHDIKRDYLFSDIKYADKVFYEHLYWDDIVGPTEYKKSIAEQSVSDYLLFISDDIIVSKNWDLKIFDFMQKNMVVSGTGKLNLFKKNLFFLDQKREESEEFSLTNFIDRNFIFGPSHIFKNVYPSDVKYYGEEELLSIMLFDKNVSIWSTPSGLYSDISLRTLENKYVTFSLEHGYNRVMDIYMHAPQKFLDLIGVDRSEIYRLPYVKDDVAYRPYELDYTGGSKFIFKTNKIS